MLDKLKAISKVSDCIDGRKDIVAALEATRELLEVFAERGDDYGWVMSELNGFSSAATIPSYRKVPRVIKGVCMTNTGVVTGFIPLPNPVLINHYAEIPDPYPIDIPQRRLAGLLQSATSNDVKIKKLKDVDKVDCYNIQTGYTTQDVYVVCSDTQIKDIRNEVYQRCVSIRDKIKNNHWLVCRWQGAIRAILHLVGKYKIYLFIALVLLLLFVLDCRIPRNWLSEDMLSAIPKQLIDMLTK